MTSKKKIIIFILCGLFLISVSVFCLFSCGHEHTFSKEWSFDENYHWHQATCKHKDLVSDKEHHIFDEGHVTHSPTAFEKGEIVYKCIVCGYEKKEVLPEISPETPDFTLTENYKLERVYDGKEVEFPSKDDYITNAEGNINFYFKKDGKILTEKPCNAGSYVLCVEIPKSGECEKFEKQFNLNIKKAESKITVNGNGNFEKVYNKQAENLID